MESRFETFTVLIAKINRSIRRIKIQEMSEYNLRGAQVSCLYYLYMQDNLTATDLCDRCEEDKATISRTIAYLEENGFVSCKSDSAKRYKSPLALTEKGKTVGKEIVEKIDRVLETVSVGLTEEERADFYRSLTTISNHLERIANSLDS